MKKKNSEKKKKQQSGWIVRLSKYIKKYYSVQGLRVSGVS